MGVGPPLVGLLPQQQIEGCYLTPGRVAGRNKKEITHCRSVKAGKSHNCTCLVLPGLIKLLNMAIIKIRKAFGTLFLFTVSGFPSTCDWDICGHAVVTFEAFKRKRSS